MDDLLLTLRERAAKAERSLKEYIRQAWPIVEPATPFVNNWHIGLISEYLEAVSQLQLRNLIINIPPRCMKSLLVSVMWPTWLWTHTPSKRFLFSSYGQDLAIRDSLKSRRLLQSDWYQQRWGDRFKLTGDQNAKQRYENDKTGYRVSFGVGGAVTGEGGDILVVDDPLKAQDADSDAVRGSINEWWDETWSTRGNDPKTVCRVIIMQRLHEDDLTGHVIDKMQQAGAEPFEVVCLPMEYEPHRFFSGYGKSDPRRQPGELLWKARFGQPEVDALKVVLGPRAAAGQLQQRPAPDTGLVFQREWFTGQNRYDAEHGQPFMDSVGRWISIDTALKVEEQNDYTAFGVGELLPDYRLIVREVMQDKLEFPQLAQTIENFAAQYRSDSKLRGVIIEDKGSGTSALQTLRQSAPAWLRELLIAFQPQGDKVHRARLASLWMERGCVLLPHPSPSVPWLFDFEETLFKFPAVKHDDQVDVISQMVLYLEHLLAEGYQLRVPQ